MPEETLNCDINGVFQPFIADFENSFYYRGWVSSMDHEDIFC